MLETLGQEILQASRRLRRRPGFALITASTLTLAIGATTAIFSILDSILLEPLAYPDSGRLASIGHGSLQTDVPRELGLTTGAYFVYRDAQSLASLAVYSATGVNVSGPDGPARVDAAAVSHEFFPILEADPLLGRTFTRADDAPEAPPIVVLSYALWSRLFGRDVGAVGGTLRLNGVPVEIVGVLPPEFSFAVRHLRDAGRPNPELWLPLRLDPNEARNVNFYLRGLARLAEGATAEQARAELDALFERPFELYSNEGVSGTQLREAGVRPTVRPLRETVVGEIGILLWVAMTAVGLILVVAAANVANLFLVQAERRAREVAVRRALGAGRRRVARAFMIESAGLCAIGAGLGVALAMAAVRLVVAFGPPDVPRLDEVALDRTALGLVAGLAVATTLFFGAFPITRLATWRRTSALMEAGRGTSATPRNVGARDFLVITQLALALVLLAGSGLMLRTFWNLHSVEPGFRTDHLLTFQVSLPPADYPGNQQALSFHQRALDLFERVPGVVSATAGPYGLPIQSQGNSNPIWVEDRPTPVGQLPESHPIRIVMPGYLETLGVPMVAGRPIDRRDLDQETGAVVVSESFAQRHWPGEDPLGKRVRGVPDWEWLTVVGVAGDVRQDALHEPSVPTIYWGARLTTGRSYAGTHTMTYAVRTVGPPMERVGAIRAVMGQLDPAVPIAGVATMTEVVAESIRRTSFTMSLLVIAAIVSVILGAIGVYSVIAYVVARRTREIGIRMALGASPAVVTRMVVARAGVVVAIGLGAGLLGAAVVTRFLDALLYDVEPLDPATFVIVSLGLAATAVCASLVPARRAARVDPADSLRDT